MDVRMREQLKPGSVVRLSFEVPAQEVRQVLTEVQDKYAKTLQLPGFRRGKVPIAVIERKFGEALRAEALQEVVNRVLEEHLPKAEHAPLSMDRPRLVDTDLKWEEGKDLVFHVEYDTLPPFKLPAWRDIEVTVPQVRVTDEDIAAELERIRQDNAITVAKTAGGAAEGDLVTVDFCELDAAEQPVPGSERQDFTFVLGTYQNLYHFDRELAGLAVGEERVFTKDYPADFPHAELAGTTKTLRVKVKALKERKLPDLDDEFAKDVSDQFQTLEDLKAHLRRQLEENLEEEIEDHTFQIFLEELSKRVSIDLPASLIQLQLDAHWETVAQRNNLTTEKLDKVLGPEKKREILESWTEAAREGVKRDLLYEAIRKELAVEVTDEDLHKAFERHSRRSGFPLEDLKRFYTERKLMEDYRSRVLRRKVIHAIVGAIKRKNGPQQSYRQFIDGVGKK